MNKALLIGSSLLWLLLVTLWIYGFRRWPNYREYVEQYLVMVSNDFSIIYKHPEALLVPLATSIYIILFPIYFVYRLVRGSNESEGLD